MLQGKGIFQQYKFEIHYLKAYHQKQPPEVFYKKCILRNFAKFTREPLCQSLFLNKVSGLGLQLY